MLERPGFPSVFSEERGYRYVLWRRTLVGVGNAMPGYVNFICLNPSTADDRVDDPTMRRLMKFATNWGYRYFAVTNLFAFRASKPETLVKAVDPIGPDNDLWIAQVARNAHQVVCSWGTKSPDLARNKAVVRLLRSEHISLWALRVTVDGHPAHPLYLPSELKPRSWIGYR